MKTFKQYLKEENKKEIIKIKTKFSKFGDIIMKFKSSTHPNPNIDKFIYDVTSFDLNGNRFFDSRVNKEFNDEKSWRNAIKRIIKKGGKKVS